jgi:hypothetical protein
MIIYYPTYYLVPVVPVISLDKDEYNLDDNMERNQRNNTYRNINEDIFEEIDEEYVNESTK